MPLLVLLIGGGLYFTIYSRFVPFLYLPHRIQILRGKFSDPNDPGEINHFQALCSALSGTVGMGNITGVAVAVTTGGAGSAVLDVGLRAGRDGHQVFHLQPRRHVPRQGSHRPGAGRPDVFHR